jgi:hypothetical protein
MTQVILIYITASGLTPGKFITLVCDSPAQPTTLYRCVGNTPCSIPHFLYCQHSSPSYVQPSIYQRDPSFIHPYLVNLNTGLPLIHDNPGR